MFQCSSRGLIVLRRATAAMHDLALEDVSRALTLTCPRRPGCRTCRHSSQSNAARRARSAVRRTTSAGASVRLARIADVMFSIAASAVCTAGAGVTGAWGDPTGVSSCASASPSSLLCGVRFNNVAGSGNVKLVVPAGGTVAAGPGAGAASDISGAWAKAWLAGPLGDAGRANSAGFLLTASRSSSITAPSSFTRLGGVSDNGSAASASSFSWSAATAATQLTASVGTGPAMTAACDTPMVAEVAGVDDAGTAVLVAIQACDGVGCTKRGKPRPFGDFSWGEAETAGRATLDVRGTSAGREAFIAAVRLGGVPAAAPASRER